MYQPNESWIWGKYEWGVYHNGKKCKTIEVEIDGHIPFVAIGEFYAQGDSASTIIDQIHNIWSKGDITPKTAIKKWADIYLSEY